MPAVLDETEFRVIVGEENPEEGQTHVLHINADKNTTYPYKAPLSYGAEFGQALLFREGYWLGSLLVRVQRKMGEQWVDHI